MSAPFQYDANFQCESHDARYNGLNDSGDIERRRYSIFFFYSIVTLQNVQETRGYSIEARISSTLLARTEFPVSPLLNRFWTSENNNKTTAHVTTTFYSSIQLVQTRPGTSTKQFNSKSMYPKDECLFEFFFINSFLIMFDGLSDCDLWW